MTRCLRSHGGAGTQTAGRACHGKRRYDTQPDAVRARAELINLRGGCHTLRAYRCPTDPGHWHVGHRPGSRRKR